MAADDALQTGPHAAGSGVSEDSFYRGTIVRLCPGSGSGVLRTGNGREVAFAAPDVLILGAALGFAALREGMRVGFDLGRTSRGLRVTKISISDDLEE